ncbi:MAG: hypothetical protein RL068_1005 [Actinomycetota bacterium]
MFSAPANAQSQILEILAPFGTSKSFSGQPLEVTTNQLRTSLNIDSPEIPNVVASLARTGSIFELEVFATWSERYLHHPALGISRAVLDDAGEIVLRAGQLEALLMETGGNLSEFSRGFRRLTQTPWLDLVEPYRKVADYAVALPRAV